MLWKLVFSAVLSAETPVSFPSFFLLQIPAETGGSPAFHQASVPVLGANFPPALPSASAPALFHALAEAYAQYVPFLVSASEYTLPAFHKLPPLPWVPAWMAQSAPVCASVEQQLLHGVVSAARWLHR